MKSDIVSRKKNVHRMKKRQRKTENKMEQALTLAKFRSP